jgi:hypothetical protein
MSIKIEKNIPAPNHKKGTQWPFALMNVGDSFLGTQSARTASFVWAKKHNHKFASKRENGLVRIWRIA